MNASRIAGEATIGAASEGPLIQARSLSKVYRMGDVTVHALRDVDLSLRAGEMLVLLGASGSGKSTLLNILGGTMNGGLSVADGRARLQTVVLGHRGSESAEVVSGVRGGRVIALPWDLVADDFRARAAD